MKKCIYCNVDIDSESVVDICQPCMYQVWGKKMSETIVANMEREKSNGNLKLWSNEKEDGIEEKKEIGEIGIVENRDKVEEPEIFHEPRKVEFEGVEMEEIEID